MVDEPAVRKFKRAFDDACLLYEYMLKHSTEDSGNSKTRIYTGAPTTWYLEQFPGENMHYSRAMRVLLKMYCVDQVRRGNRYVKSEYRLHFKPNATVYNEMARQGELREILLVSPTHERERQRINDINQRLSNIESQIEGLYEICQDLKKQVDAQDAIILGGTQVPVPVAEGSVLEPTFVTTNDADGTIQDG